jgi:hypothetical protein
MAKRTTLRSSKGTKLYAVRNEDGSFADIQTYKRAHRMDIKRNAKAEGKKKTKKKAAKKTASKTAKKGKKKASKKK